LLHSNKYIIDIIILKFKVGPVSLKLHFNQLNCIKIIAATKTKKKQLLLLLLLLSAAAAAAVAVVAVAVSDVL
jgi:hypothetical protein